MAGLVRAAARLTLRVAPVVAVRPLSGAARPVLWPAPMWAARAPLPLRALLLPPTPAAGTPVRALAVAKIGRGGKTARYKARLKVCACVRTRPFHCARALTSNGPGAGQAAPAAGRQRRRD
jgi:hypothetical protein